MTHKQLYSKLQKDYTIAAQQYHQLPTDVQVGKNWQKALHDLLSFFLRFKGRKIKATDEVVGKG